MKKKVFVSYTHADDEPFDEGTPGWVSFFIDKLRRAVARQAGGELVEFWMDHRHEPQRRVDDELRNRLRESEVILALISPRYVASEWCTKEMATFVAEVGGGVSADRVFMVEVLPTERDTWHPAVRDLNPVKFWVSDLTRPEPKTLGWPVPNVRADREYWDEVNALASILARQLREWPVQMPPAGAMAPAPTAGSPAATASSSGDVQATPLPAAATGDAAAELSIVINADDPDQTLAKDTQEALGELDIDGYVAPTMLPDQNPADFRRQFEQLLRESRGVIVVYGVAPPSWVQAKFAAVKKVLAQQRKGTWAGLLEGPPAPKPGHGLPPRGLMVLDCKQGIDKAELARFVEALKSGSGAAAAGTAA